MATTRLYVQNATAPYVPTTIRGAWDITTSAVTGKLDPAKAGAATTRAQAETSTNTTWDVLWGRWISDSLLADYSFTTSDTVQWIIGARETTASSLNFFHVHVYVTTGDSDTVRGTLLTDNIGATEFPSTATGRGEGTKTLASVSALRGDRIVVEIGYQAQNSTASSRTSTMNYGNTGGTDLTSGSTSVTTQPGWVEFVTGTGLTFGTIAVLTMGVGGKPFGWGLKPALPVISWGAPLTCGLVFDANFHQLGTSILKDLASNVALTTAGETTYRQGPYGTGASFPSISTAAKISGTTPSAVNSLTTLSIEMLFLIKSGTTRLSYPLVKRSGDEWNPGLAYFYILYDNNDLGLQLYSDWATTQGRWRIAISQGVWYHLIITYNYIATTDAPVFYLNGALPSVSVYSTPVGAKGTDNANIYIGNDQNNNRQSDFDISYVRIWNRILSSNEARALYENPWRIYRRGAPLFGYKKPLSLMFSPHRQQHLLVR